MTLTALQICIQVLSFTLDLSISIQLWPQQAVDAAYRFPGSHCRKLLIHVANYNCSRRAVVLEATPALIFVGADNTNAIIRLAWGALQSRTNPCASEFKRAQKCYNSVPLVSQQYCCTSGHHI